jgi:DNA (cytosine-5)-methyltransferase 1
MAFEQSGSCVVRGPDPLFGTDIRTFHPPPGFFQGVIGGPPCQDFSSARRTPPTGEGNELIAEFIRIVQETRPNWALMENVPRVPSITIRGYNSQRLDVDGTMCGLTQLRRRHFQFFHDTLFPLAMPRPITPDPTEPAATATEARRAGRREWPHFCKLQGLTTPLELSSLTVEARYHAVGNGVPIPMGRLIAAAIARWATSSVTPRLCPCGCGRPLTGAQLAATIACRQRLSRRRRRLTQPPPT